MTLDEKGLVLSCPNCGQRNRLAYERLDAQTRCGHCKSPLAPPAAPIEITSPAEFDALTRRSSLPVFIDFWAPWCGPCKMVAPEVEKVAASANGQFLVAKMNTDQVPDIARQLEISSIPTMAIFHRARELQRIAGARPAPSLLAFIRDALART